MPNTPPFPIDVEHTREQARNATDLCAATEGSALQSWQDNDREKLTKLCRVPYDLTSTSPLRVEVFTKLIELFPVFNLIPGPQTEDNLDYAYAPIRILLAGAGYEAHDKLAQALLAVDPRAPFVPQQTKETWLEEIHAAHLVCGLPVTLPLLPFHKVIKCCNEASEQAQLKFLIPLTALHILKHTRRTTRDIRVLYHSRVSYLNHESMNLDEAAMRRVRSQLIGPALGLMRPKGVKAAETRAYDTTGQTLNCFSAASLLYAQPRSYVPPSVLWSVFSGLMPAEGLDDFSEIGLKLSGVWEGVYRRGGHEVITAHGTETSAYRYAWKIDPESDADMMTKEIFLKGVPKTYEKKLPADILFEYFPNVDLTWTEHPAAALAIYDAMLSASIVRHYRRADMAIEFPMLWVMPADVSPLNATSNGKTYMSRVLAMVTNPSLRLKTVKDSGSAPDSRAIQSDIENDGTIALDDWSLISTKDHILYYGNLQTLTVGEGYTGGKVLENETPAMYLRENMVINAKCAELPPDLENRSVFIWLNPLTEKEKQDTAKTDLLMSGRVGMQMRLAADLWVNDLGLQHVLAIGNEAWRYSMHFAMMVAFAKVRGVNDPEATLTATLRKMFAHSRYHYHRAQDSGLASLAEGGEILRVRLGDVFHDLTHQQLEYIRADTQGKALPASLFLRRRLESLSNEVKPFRVLLGEIGVAFPPKAKDKQISLAFETECRSRMPFVGDKYRITASPLGVWWMARKTTNDYALEFEPVTLFTEDK